VSYSHAGKQIISIHAEVPVTKSLQGAVEERDRYKLTSFRNELEKFRMKRIAVWTLLMVLAVGGWTATEAQYVEPSKSARQTEKSEQKQRNALYKYQKQQQKAQEKAQRRADKQQRKAAKKYEKQQRKQLKNANVSIKHTP
jgi:hypothetical protein